MAKYLLRKLCKEPCLEDIRDWQHLSTKQKNKVPSKMYMDTLIASCVRGRCDVVNVLLESLPSPDYLLYACKSGQTSLMVASEGGHLDIVRQLCQIIPEQQVLLRCSEGRTPLLYAVKNKHRVVADHLCQFVPERQVMINECQMINGCQMSALMYAVDSEDLILAQQLCKYVPEQQVLVQSCIDYENDYKCTGYTPLMHAISGGKMEMVKYLCQFVPEKQVMMTSKHIKHEEIFVFTVLTWVSVTGNVDILNYLMQFISKKQLEMLNDNTNMTPMSFFIFENQTSCVKAMCAYDGGVSPRDVAMLKQYTKSSGCASCGSKTAHLKSCSKCRLFYYCSKECLMKDWRTDHKPTCRLLR
jgi:ankyrin repeat protein